MWGSLFFFQLQLGELEMSAAESNAFAGRGSYFPLLCVGNYSQNGHFHLLRGSREVLSMYVILQSTIGWRKVKICWFNSGNWFWLCLMVHYLGWPLKGTLNVQIKSVINMIQLVLCVFLLAHHNDWSRWFAICCSSFSFKAICLQINK